MAVTIHDIARRVGVNSSTVSRVLNGKSAISEETREKIYTAMKEMDYHPNSVARSLANGSSGAIGLAIDACDTQSFANMFFHRSMFAIEKVAQANGFNLIISSNLEEKGKSSPIEKLILERKVDGLILPPSTVSPKLITKMTKLDFPFVILGEPNQPLPEASWVDVNNAQGGEAAVLHLLAQGYQRIAYLGGNENQRFVRNRIKGYRRGLEAGGFFSSLVIQTDGSTGDIKAQAQKLIASSDRPDAFLCNDNAAAYGLLKVAKETGLHVPRDIGVVTFDNYPLAEFTDPPLTAVDIDTALLGEQAASLLFQRLGKHTPNQQILLSATLIQRESTKRV
jgi:DNA-binding LacI/PurR family transcriptional regulator